MPPRVENRIGRNGWIGIRLDLFLQSDEAWEVGHKAAWPVTRACIALSLASTIIIFALDSARPEEELGYLAAITSCAFIMCATVAGTMNATSAVQKLESESRTR